MKLYSHSVQPNAIRVLMFIDEKGIDMDIVDLDMINGEHKGKDFLKKNPGGQVPTLQTDDGMCITESIVICRYLDELYGPPYLFGEDLKERAVISMWERILELGLFIPATEYAHHTTPELKHLIDQYPDWAESLLPGMKVIWARLDLQLKEHKFVAGERFSVADIIGFLGVKYAEIFVGLKPESHSYLGQWLHRVSERKGTQSFHTGLGLMSAYKEAIGRLSTDA